MLASPLNISGSIGTSVAQEYVRARVAKARARFMNGASRLGEIIATTERIISASVEVAIENMTSQRRRGDRRLGIFGGLEVSKTQARLIWKI